MLLLWHGETRVKKPASEAGKHAVSNYVVSADVFTQISNHLASLSFETRPDYDFLQQCLAAAKTVAPPAASDPQPEILAPHRAQLPVAPETAWQQQQQQQEPLGAAAAGPRMQQDRSGTEAGISGQYVGQALTVRERSMMQALSAANLLPALEFRVPGA